jgi:pimeloyl-ACP methyl ester carboxylesterase
MNLLDRHAIVDGVRLAYHYTLGDSGEAVVLLHGTPSHSFIWRNVIPELEAQGHGVLAFDLLGYGESERPMDRDTSVTAQTRVLDLLLQYLGIRRCTLIGHDIGGAVAQIFATQHQQRVTRMMLIDTVSYDSWPSATWQQIIRERLDDYATMPKWEFEDMLIRQLRMTVSHPDRMSGPVLDAYLAPYRTAVGRMSFFEHQVRHYDSGPTQRVAPLLGSLSMPVRIVWGEHDRWQPVEYGERLYADVPAATLAIVTGAGHFVMEDAPEPVIEEIEHLLRTSTEDCPRNATVQYS